MKTLILITSQYPFGNGEPFIAEELEHLAEEFRRVIIIAQNTSLKTVRRVPDNVKVYRYNPSTSVPGFILIPFKLVSRISSIKRILTSEKEFRIRTGFSMTKSHWLFLIRKIIKAIQLEKFIREVITLEKPDVSVVFYSYWFNTGAHALSILKYDNCIRIARGHGSDLYEERSPQKYLPMLSYISTALDGLFFISDNGRDYFLERTGADQRRCFTSRLGISIKVPENHSRQNNKDFNIVSCSNLIPLKRVGRIIEALALVRSEKRISWTHFGSGPLLDELRVLAEEKLGSRENVSYRFAGYVENTELLKYYSQNPVDLFLNVSITEGVPVSIMEAQAFGIPVLATDVGGVGELVNKENGLLLDAGFSSAELAEKLVGIIEMPNEKISELRKNAVISRETKYNSDINYPEFIIKVNSILAGQKGR